MKRVASLGGAFLVGFVVPFLALFVLSRCAARPQLDDEIAPGMYVQSTSLFAVDPSGKWVRLTVGVPFVPDAYAAACVGTTTSDRVQCWYVDTESGTSVLLETVTLDGKHT